MVLCEFCFDFYHYNCIKENKSNVKKYRKYKCPKCRENSRSDMIYNEGLITSVNCSQCERFCTVDPAKSRLIKLSTGCETQVRDTNCYRMKISYFSLYNMQKHQLPSYLQTPTNKWAESMLDVYEVCRLWWLVGVELITDGHCVECHD